MRVVTYARVSTDKQADNGVSLDEQRTRMTAYCQTYRLELVREIKDEGQSAKSLDRPGLQEALRMLKDGEADALLVTKLDRLTRSLHDLLGLVEGYFKVGVGVGAALMSVDDKVDTSTPSGRMMLNVLASIGQWQREEIAARVKSSVASAQQAGRKLGGPVPMGFKPELRKNEKGKTVKVLVADPAGQAVVARVRELHGLGTSYRKIADQLHHEGLVARVLGPESIRRILTSKTVAVRD